MSTDQTSTTTNTINQPGKSSPKAVCYIRVACLNQVQRDGEEDSGIAAQRQACQKLAEQLGLSIVDEYIDAGKSGVSMKQRKALQEMLARIKEQHDVSHVIVYELSRLTRNSIEAALLLKRFQEAGVELVAATGSISSTPEGQMIQGLMSIIDQFVQYDEEVDEEGTLESH